MPGLHGLDLSLDLIDGAVGVVTLARSDLNSASGGYVLTKVAVPATSSVAGNPGDFAVSSSFCYFYTGDGTTHSWVRTAVATW